MEVTREAFAAVLAFFLLLGLGVGWYLMPRPQTPPVTVTVTAPGGARTETLLSTSIITLTAYVTLERTVTALIQGVQPLRILLPGAVYQCANGTLEVSFFLANAATEPVTVNATAIVARVPGARLIGRSVQGFSAGDVLVLDGGGDAMIRLFFSVEDWDAIRTAANRTELGGMRLRVSVDVPYWYRGAEYRAVLGSVFVGTIGECQFLKD